MALNSPEVLKKIKANLAERTKNYKHAKLDSSEVLRSGLAKSITGGMQEAFSQVRNRGRDMAFKILGVDTSWSSWDLKKGPLSNSLLQELEPDIDELAKQIAQEFRDKDLNKMTKTRRNQIMKDLRRTYDDEVSLQVRTHFADVIVAQARKDVEDLWEHIPALLKDGNTMEDVVAEHFTAMIAQDADLNEENFNDHLRDVQRYMEWRMHDTESLRV